MLNLMTNPLATLATLYSFAEERLKREEKGATAVEYGLMVGLIAVAIIGAVVFLSDQLEALFNSIGGDLQDAATTPAAPMIRAALTVTSSGSPGPSPTPNNRPLTRDTYSFSDASALTAAAVIALPPRRPRTRSPASPRAGPASRPRPCGRRIYRWLGIGHGGLPSLRRAPAPPPR